MAETQKGVGVVWSTGDITITAGIVSGTTTASIQTTDFNRRSDKTYIKGADGASTGVIFYNFMKDGRLTAIPTGTTIALAETSLDAWMPKPGTTLTFADSGTGTIIEDNYNVTSAKQTRTVDGATAVDIEFEASEDNELAGTAIAAA